MRLSHRLPQCSEAAEPGGKTDWLEPAIRTASPPKLMGAVVSRNFPGPAGLSMTAVCSGLRVKSRRSVSRTALRESEAMPLPG
jgi:hypothetical protein